MTPASPIAPAAEDVLSTPGKAVPARATSLRWICPAVALILGACAAWTARFTMFPDGVSYLDIGDAYWRGNWHNPINAYWSPLYSWILGAFLRVFSPSIQGEFPLVHLANFLIYVVALIAFAFFLETFLGSENQKASEIVPDEHTGLPIWAWYVVGYSAFVTASLFLITISFASGDMIVSAIIYFASGLLLRIDQGKVDTWSFVLLGLALGIGYYAKTAMLLIAFPYLAIAALVQWKRAGSLKPAALSWLVFLLIVAPFIVSLSVSKGRPTFGDSGSINYAVNVGTVQFFIPNEPGLKHPVRRVPGPVEAYEYAQPISGTYPLWYDPTYWHEGIHPHFNLWRQIRTLGLTAAECAWISFNVFLGLHISAAILFLYLISPAPSRCVRSALRNWIVWVPAFAGIALYALVVIEPRYVGGQFCVLWIVAFAGVRLPRSKSSLYLISAAVLIVALITCGITIRDSVRNSRYIGLAEKNVATPEIPKVAEAVAAHGLRPGDKIAVVSDWLFPSREGAYIARLARLQIIGEARPEDFWTADESARSQLITTFTDAGASALFTYKPPRIDPGWERLAGTDYYLYRIDMKERTPAERLH